MKSRPDWAKPETAPLHSQFVEHRFLSGGHHTSETLRNHHAMLDVATSLVGGPQSNLRLLSLVRTLQLSQVRCALRRRCH